MNTGENIQIGRAFSLIEIRTMSGSLPAMEYNVNGLLQPQQLHELLEVEKNHISLILRILLDLRCEIYHPDNTGE